MDIMILIYVALNATGTFLAAFENQSKAEESFRLVYKQVWFGPLTEAGTISVYRKGEIVGTILHAILQREAYNFNG